MCQTSHKNRWHHLHICQQISIYTYWAYALLYHLHFFSSLLIAQSIFSSTPLHCTVCASHFSISFFVLFIIFFCEAYLSRFCVLCCPDSYFTIFYPFIIYNTYFKYVFLYAFYICLIVYNFIRILILTLLSSSFTLLFCLGFTTVNKCDIYTFQLITKPKTALNWKT